MHTPNLRLLAAAISIAAIFFSVRAATLPDDSTLRREAARLLLVGFTGDRVNDTCDAARYVRDLHVGGVVLFDIDLTGTAKIGSRNFTSPEQLKALTAALQGYAGNETLIIAADQEGGRVCRLKTQYGFRPTVAARHLGELDNPDTTAHYAESIASELTEHGINLNLAPVVDTHNPDCPALGKFNRAFSDDTGVITRNAAIFIDRHHAHGVCCALKHFPGHGSATTDSHWGFVDVTSSWQEKELEPFRDLIANGRADAIMTAHIFNRGLDSELPATLSSKIINGVLRHRLNFDGVVISDDLYMEAIFNNYSIERAIALALNAGVDLLCVGNNISTGFESERPFKLVDIIVGLVKDGTVPYERIKEANRRILTLKSKIKAKNQ